MSDVCAYVEEEELVYGNESEILRFELDETRDMKNEGEEIALTEYLKLRSMIRVMYVLAASLQVYGFLHFSPLVGKKIEYRSQKLTRRSS